MRAHYSVEGVEISKIGRIQIADNGKKGDAHSSILLCHSDIGDVWLVVTTNGDDLLLGFVDDFGCIEFNEDADPKLSGFDDIDRIAIEDLVAPLLDGCFVKMA